MRLSYLDEPKLGTGLRPAVDFYDDETPISYLHFIEISRARSRDRGYIQTK